MGGERALNSDERLLGGAAVLSKIHLASRSGDSIQFDRQQALDASESFEVFEGVQPVAAPVSAGLDEVAEFFFPEPQGVRLGVEEAACFADREELFILDNYHLHYLLVMQQKVRTKKSGTSSGVGLSGLIDQHHP